MAVVQYWSMHPLGPWAEHLRYHDVRDPVEARELYARPRVSRLDLPVDILHVDFDTAAAHGISADDLVDDDWAACQDWAATLTVPGILVPSAALPGTESLVLFGPMARVPYGAEPIGPIDLPCDATADMGAVTPDLLRLVRWRGSTHLGLKAWRAGGPPVPTPAVSYPAP
ncbi:MAG: hypothetical protein H0W25_19650 [Acidimicrobiia bacterium]|nr:hypothetical protein [Acidimicrobiia bacterium]